MGEALDSWVPMVNALPELFYEMRETVKCCRIGRVSSNEAEPFRAGREVRAGFHGDAPEVLDAGLR
jgi:hypothetical protein